MGQSTNKHNNKYANSNQKRQKLVGKIRKIRIEGYKSIKEIDFELTDINVLIGANGAGKSNFLGFFEMLGWMFRSGNLQEYISRKGGSDDLLFNGRKITRSISAYIEFHSVTGQTEYQFTLSDTEKSSLVFTQEEYRFNRKGMQAAHNRWKILGVGHQETGFSDRSFQRNDGRVLFSMLRHCTIYQFHDTSSNSPLKQQANVDDSIFLRSDGINLASVLYDLKNNEPAVYKEIVEIIQQVLPNFGGFELEPKYNKVILNWVQKNNSNKTFSPNLTSDGSLRFFALATLLCMPKDRISDVILLDEPELGMHPYAITTIAQLIQRLGRMDKQVIVATQSPLLVSQFDTKNIIVTEMEDSATRFKKLPESEIQEWLEDYDTGELWQKNIFGGNPI